MLWPTIGVFCKKNNQVKRVSRTLTQDSRQHFPPSTHFLRQKFYDFWETNRSFKFLLIKTNVEDRSGINHDLKRKIIKIIYKFFVTSLVEDVDVILFARDTDGHLKSLAPVVRARFDGELRGEPERQHCYSKTQSMYQLSSVQLTCCETFHRRVSVGKHWELVVQTPSLRSSKKLPNPSCKVKVILTTISSQFEKLCNLGNCYKVHVVVTHWVFSMNDLCASGTGESVRADEWLPLMRGLLLLADDGVNDVALTFALDDDVLCFCSNAAYLSSMTFRIRSSSSIVRHEIP